MIPEKLLPRAPATKDTGSGPQKMKEKIIAGTPKKARSLLRNIKALIFFAVFALCLFVAGSIFWVNSREVHFRPDIAPLYGREIPVEGGVMFTQTEGTSTNPAIVFVHDAYAWSEIWKPVMQELSDDEYYLVAPDMPPFGFSSRSAVDAYSRKDQAERLQQTLTELNVKPVILVAHGYGARAAAEYATSNPNNVRGVVLISPDMGNIYNDFETNPTHWSAKLYEYGPIRFGLTATLQTNPFLTRSNLASQMYQTGAATDQLVAVYQEPLTLLQTSVDYGAWHYNYLKANDTGDTAKREGVKSFEVPVAIIWGEEDTTTPYWQAFELQKYIPRSEIYTISAVGHFPFIEDRVRFMKAFREAVNMIEQGGPSASATEESDE